MGLSGGYEVWNVLVRGGEVESRIITTIMTVGSNLKSMIYSPSECGHPHP
jgi:hypothetical protein